VKAPNFHVTDFGWLGGVMWLGWAAGGDWFEASLMLKITYVLEAVWWYLLGGHRAHLS
jgi:hypothetical protein